MPSRVSKPYSQHISEMGLRKLIVGNSEPYSPDGILTRQIQPLRAEVWTLTMQCLDDIGQSMEDSIFVCLYIAISKSLAIVRDISL